MKTLTVPVAVFLLSCAIVPAETPPSPDLAGRWSSEFDTPIGHLKYIYEFKVDVGELTGTAVRERDQEKKETALKRLVLKGDKLSFLEPIKIQEQDVNIEYRGIIAGEEIQFTRKVGE